jgi:hypothetical protein
MPKKDPTPAGVPLDDVKTPPPSAIKTEKNHQLSIPGMTALPSSQDMFGEMDLDVKEYLRVLYYGDEGSAKTTNAATLANGGKTLIINAEGGAKRRALLARGVDVTNLRFWPQKSSEKITAAGLEQVYDRLQADLDADEDSWYGVIFDSATDIVQALTAQVSDDRITKARRRGIEIDDVDSYFTDVADYGTMGKMFVDKIRKYRTLPCHLAITALQRRDVDKTSSVVTYGPAVTPGVATSLLGYVDIVLACKAEDEKRPYRGMSAGSDLYRMKDRYGILPKIMVEPTMERIIKYLEGDLTVDSDKLQALMPQPEKKLTQAEETAQAVTPPAEETKPEPESPAVDPEPEPVKGEPVKPASRPRTSRKSSTTPTTSSTNEANKDN